MELLVVYWLIGALQRRRRRTYTAEQLQAIKREAAQREAGTAPRIEAPARCRRWWEYEGLY